MYRTLETISRLHQMPFVEPSKSSQVKVMSIRRQCCWKGRYNESTEKPAFVEREWDLRTSHWTGLCDNNHMGMALRSAGETRGKATGPGSSSHV